MSRRLLLRLLASAPRTDHVTDAELLRRFVASNDAAAFELLVRRHADAVWAACRRVLRCEADAEDAFQATFLVLIRKARSVRTPCAGGWLQRVAVNAALKLRERTARTASVEPNQLDALPAPLASTADDELAAAVHEELARLSERERLPIVLCDLEGMSHADAATALGWPVGTVSGRLSRARAKLRARLKRRGLAPSAALLPALGAPAHLLPNALSLTAGGASPAVVSLSEGVLAMTSTAWKWVAVATVCVGLTGAVAGLMHADAGPDGAPPPERAADNPVPVGKDKPAEQQWLPKPGAGRINDVDASLVPTAFPELVLPEPDQKDPESEQKRQAAFEKLCPRFARKIAVAIEPTDDTYRKLLKARLYIGVSQMNRIRGLMVSRTGSWANAVTPELYDCLADMEVTVLELWGTQPKELVPWLEELVVVAKDFERFFHVRVLNGSDPPQRLDSATRHRLRAEATLWKAKKRP